MRSERYGSGEWEWKEEEWWATAAAEDDDDDDADGGVCGADEEGEWEGEEGD